MDVLIAGSPGLLDCLEKNSTIHYILGEDLGGRCMPFTSRQRFLRRKQRRIRKLRQLKEKLSQTQDRTKRQNILEKIRKLSPWDPVLGE
jgi:tRNA A22 N-methylase